MILDNGRSALAARPELREALYCLRCGACLNICPVFQLAAAHLYGRVYPGAIGILLAPFLPPTGDIADLCTQCGSCGEICPAAIDLPRKIRYLRRTAPSFRRARALSGAAGLILGQRRLYRALASAAHPLLNTVGREKIRKLIGTEIPGESFFAAQNRGGEKKRFQNAVPADLVETGKNLIFSESTAEEEPRSDKCALGSPPDFISRLAEAGTTLLNLEGAAALARYLAETSKGELWLEDHPWLQPVAQELLSLGRPARQARNGRPRGADTVVTLGLGVIPELGAVVVSGGRGPAALLPLQAGHHVVLAPSEQAGLTIQAALNLVKERHESVITWLTGPTRTADIEKILVLGAQGPAAMTVVLYQPAPARK